MTAAQLMKMIKVHSGIPAGLRMLKVKRKKNKHDKLRIVFLCQLGQVWGCIQSIYEAAAADSTVEAYILAVPEHWEAGNVDKNAYKYMCECGYPVIDAYDEKKQQFYDLREAEPDYVFLPRPYDVYLPKEYQSETLSEYTKVCYVSYGYTVEDDYVLKTCFSKYFISNCYMVFAENESVRKYCIRQLPFSNRAGLRKVIQTPFPRFDLLKKYANDEESLWKRTRENVNKRIIWTPRWTLEEKLGGTNFFNYKDFFFEYAKEHAEDDFLFRPHPLAFDNFVKVGAMTQEEVALYKNACHNAPNIQLDQGVEYLANFASADILVSDMSGVVVDFAVTGKPIIFCSYKQAFNEVSRLLLDAYYVVHNQSELQETLDMLCRGEDTKKKLRLQIVRDILGSCDGGNGKRIMEHIKEDYYR